jgi:hypothetical protein
MALRVNTVEFPFTTRVTSLDADTAPTRHDFSAITVYIPENTSRTFRSVEVEVTCRDDSAVVQSLTAWLIGIKLAAVAFNDVTVTSTITNSGETQTYIFNRDVTSYFVTNFGSGTSQTCQVGVMFTGPASGFVNNITAKLIITYEYDDASQTTLIKTVKIPLDTTVGALTTTATEVGTNQIPALDTECGESSKVFRDIWIEVDGNEAVTAATATQLGITIDAGTEELDGSHDQTLISGTWYKYISRQTSMTTNAVHAFKLRSTGAAVFDHPAIILCATYEYASSSATAYNSLQIPLELDADGPSGTTSAAQIRYTVDVYIEEPTTITLKQSGVYLAYGESGAVSGPSVAAGAQTTRLYTHVVPSTRAGMCSLTHRIDSGSAAGSAGITLARGKNTLTLDVFKTSGVGNDFTPMSAMLYLNYASGKATGGIPTHNHTTRWWALDTPAAFNSKPFTPKTPNIPSTDYYVNSYGILMFGITQTAGSYSASVDAEILSGEGKADGWVNLMLWHMVATSENSCFYYVADSTPVWRRFPTDPITSRLAVETSRQFRCVQPRANWVGISQLLTHHAIKYAIAGTVTGYSGDGSGLTVNAYRSDTHEWIGTTTTAAGGTYSITWYDNTINVYVEVRQDSTRLGRSDDGLAA